MQVKERFLEKNKLINRFLYFLFIFFYFVNFSNSVLANESIEKLQKYIGNINNLSASFDTITPEAPVINIFFIINY